MSGKKKIKVVAVEGTIDESGALVPEVLYAVTDGDLPSQGETVEMHFPGCMCEGGGNRTSSGWTPAYGAGWDRLFGDPSNN